MNTWVKKIFFKVTHTSKIARCIWLLVGLVRSLKSSHKEELKKPLLCEDFSDLTNPTNNQIPDIPIAVSVVYDPFQKFFFPHACSYCLILDFNCEMKMS